MLKKGMTVEVFEYKEKIVDNSRKMEKVFKERALFHEFGSDYEEFESGGCTYSTAIVETNDGSIKNIPVDMVKVLR
jgi:hypothetical protein